MDDGRRSDPAGTVSENVGGKGVFLSVPECTSGICGGRESVADGTGEITEAIVLCMPLLVRREVYEKDPLLVEESASDYGRKGVQFAKTVRAFKQGEVQKQNFPRNGRRNCPPVVEIYPR